VTEYVPVYSKRERRSRNLGKVLFVAGVMLVLSLMSSMYFSIRDNEYQWEWVNLENEQGDKLNALMLIPNDLPVGGAPAVIITHDLGGYKEQHTNLGFELVRHGFVVMLVDMRDHGRSRGTTTYCDYYTGEPYDLIAAYEFLLSADHVDPDRIGMVGDGFGGSASIMACNILLGRNETVAAVVAWAPPMDITGLYNDNWDEIVPYIDRRMGEADFAFAMDRNNRSASLHMDDPNWTAGNVYIIYGGKDQKVPPTQFDGLRPKAELYMMADLDHDLSEDQRVLEFTIDFLYRKLDHSPRDENNFNYSSVSMANLAVHASSMAIMVFAFLMVYEVLVMKKTSRSYVAQLSRDIKPMFIGLAALIDIVAYVAISLTAGAFYNFFLDKPYLEDLLPASYFYVTLLAAGAMMMVFGMIVWYIWSYWMPRDEQRTEETCGNLRGIASGLFALVVVIINYLLGQVLLFGPNYPKDLMFIYAAAIVFIFFLGHELWMRKMLYMKVNALLSRFFLRHRLPYQLTLFGVMLGLYALLSWVMLYNVGNAHFDKDFGSMYVLFVLAIGTVSTIIFHRSKSILASTTYSAIIGVWLLNLAHHL